MLDLVDGPAERVEPVLDVGHHGVEQHDGEVGARPGVEPARLDRLAQPRGRLGRAAMRQRGPR